MAKKRNPFIRVPLAIAVLLMLYYMPTREFLKVTFMLGVPFIFLVGFMVRRPRYSWLWNLGALGVMIVIGAYGYQLIHLPERIQVHRIVSDGAVLLAEGRYDEAVAVYQQLSALGQTETMEEKIAIAEGEKAASQQLAYGKQLLERGETSAARQVFQSIPAKTWAGQEARDILNDLK